MFMEEFSPSPSSNYPEQWVWMHCPVCNHSVMTTYGFMPDQDLLEDFQERGWCTVCGKLGCLTRSPSWDVTRKHGPGPKLFDPDQSREAYLGALGKADKRRFMVIDTQTLEVKREQLTLGQAVSKMIRLSGFTPLLTASWRAAHLSVLKGERERVATVDVCDATLSAAQRWATVLSRVALGDLFESRFRVMTNDLHRMMRLPNETG